MAEQYVYTKANLDRGNASGFTSRTDGIVGAIQAEIQALAMARREVKSAAGTSMPVWEKICLSGRGDKVILQKTQFAHIPEGVVQKSSGYVLDLKEELLVRPAAWGALDYKIQQEQVTLAPAHVTMTPLGQILEYFAISQQQLLQLVKSCFAAKVNGDITLIAIDHTRPDALAMGNQLLMWIYSLLPFALRRQLNCTTCYTGQQGCKYHLGLVPAHMLSGSRSLLHREDFRGRCTLFAGGRLESDSDAGRKSAIARNGIYSQWLEVMIRQLVTPGNLRGEQLLQELDGVYRRFDRMISSLPEADRFKLNYYDALCWHFLRQEQQDSAGYDHSDLTCLEDLLTFGNWPEVLSGLDHMLDTLQRSCSAPATAQQIRLIARLVLLDAEESTLNRGRELLSALLARDMESAELGESSAVSARYLQLMQQAGMERSAALQQLGCVFFPQEFAATPAAQQLWDSLETSRLGIEGIRRCNDWMSGYVNVCLNAEELIDCADTVLSELKGLPQRLLEQALDCLVGAQESRCYYARLEILPIHLETCRHHARSAEGKHPVIGRYYSRLLKLLCRQYVSYWSGKTTLTSICNLSEGLTRAEWLSPDRSYLGELVLAQCAFLGEYDWQRLKATLDSEDEGILDRLWQVLDLLDWLEADADLHGLVSRQVFRYILHRVPEYVNDQWLVARVQPRQQLRSEGYYLELVTIRSFLAGDQHTLEQLQWWIKNNHVPQDLMQDMMKFLLRVFQQGGLPRLSVVAAQGLFIANRDRLKLTQVDVFRAICRHRGGSALIALLNCWPTAPIRKDLPARQLKKAQSSARPATYPWMKTGKSLLDALDRLTQDQQLMELAGRDNQIFCLELSNAIEALSPMGTQTRSTARNICIRLLTMQEGRGSLKIKMQCNAEKRRLMAEQKGSSQ